MQTSVKIPSPIQAVQHPILARAGVSLFIKREDLIHPAISGNKWRKLIYNLQVIKQQNAVGFVTFGGAFSNHISACAFAAKVAGVNSIAFVRGHEADINNPTLSFATRCGMRIIPISREAYKTKNTPEFLAKINANYPNYLIIPEGGSNVMGAKGCTEILPEIKGDFDFVACPMGTATTFTGLLASATGRTKLLGFPAVKGGLYLRDDVHNLLYQMTRKNIMPPTFTPVQWEIIPEYHFGGFGKVNKPLVEFMNAFFASTKIPLDPIYTGKMLFGLFDKIAQNHFVSGTKILAIHTGGLQGIKPMNARLQNKDYSINYEKAVADHHLDSYT